MIGNRIVEALNEKSLCLHVDLVNGASFLLRSATLRKPNSTTSIQRRHERNLPPCLTRTRQRARPLAASLDAPQWRRDMPTEQATDRSVNAHCFSPLLARPPPRPLLDAQTRANSVREVENRAGWQELALGDSAEEEKIYMKNFRALARSCSGKILVIGSMVR